MPKTPSPRRYTVEELLALAESPLVEKPAGLPPIEEWMGPPPSTSRPATTRARTDGDITAHEEGSKSMASNRRPSLFGENRGLSGSRDIVLGPPKLSFASAFSTKKLAFDFDTSHSASLNSPSAGDEDSSPRFDRFRMQARDRDKDGGRIGDRNDVRGARRNIREEPEGTSTERAGPGTTGTSRIGLGARQPRKSFGAEDGDRFRRTGDNSKDRPQRYENFGRDRERRPGGKRDESSWILDEPRDNRDRDSRGDNRERNDRDTRDNRDSRGERDFRNFSRDNRQDNNSNSRYNKVEKEPEWLDAMPNEDGGAGDTKGVHSMEEFQRWKARMKAANATEEKKPATPDISSPSPVEDKSNPDTPVDEKKVVAKSEILEAPPVASAPAVVENGVDRFFNFWGAPTPAQPSEQPIQVEQKHVGRSSRFTSFFAPQETPAAAAPPPIPAQQPDRMSPMPPAPDNSSNEDKEGFQRILKMLGGGGTGNGLSLGPPSTASPPQHNSPLLLHLQATSKLSPSPSNLHSSHPPPQQQHQQHQPPQHQRQEQQPQQQPQQHQGPLPPPASGLPLTSRDANADFLLQLMQRSSHHPSQQQGPPPLPSLNHHTYSGPSQMPPPPPISTSPPAFQRPPKNIPASPMFDDPAITGYRQRPNHEQNPMLQRGPPPMDRPPMDQHIPNWQQGPPQPGNQGPSQQHRPIAPPPGFARPGPQHGLPPQISSHGPPPPQFLGPPPGANLSPLPPFQMNNMPPPNFVPGPPPPPPFFGMGAPPPSNYPMPPFHHEPMMALNGPHFPMSPPHGPGKPGQGY